MTLSAEAVALGGNEPAVHSSCFSLADWVERSGEEQRFGRWFLVSRRK